MKDRQLKIEYVEIDKLIGWYKNPRINDEASKRLAKMIEEHGFLDPVIATRDGVIRAGHTRVKAAVINGMEKVPVIFVDFDSEKHAEAYSIADNKAGEWSEWDFQKLADLLLDLDTGEFDMELTGFQLDEIENLMADKDSDTKNDEFDLEEEAEKIENPVTQLKDIWLLGKHRLICGDSSEKETITQLMVNKKVDIVFTSPPYSDQRSYDEESEFKPIKHEDYVEWFSPIALNIMEILKDSGSFFINIKEDAEEGERSLYVMELMIHLRNKIGFKYVDELIWKKNGVPGGWTNRLRNDFEPIHFLAKDPYKVDIHVYDVSEEDMKCMNLLRDDFENIYHLSKGTKIKMYPKRRGTSSDDIIIYSKDNINKSSTGNVAAKGKKKKGIALPGNVIEIHKNMESLDHPAMYSVKLVEWFLHVFSNKNDILFEPFSGAGTDIIACENMNRICHAVEISPKYCDLDVKRYIDHVGTNSNVYLLRDGQKIKYEDLDRKIE